MDARKRKVVVGMSGGVDSSVAAALLVEQGYDVVGMMLRLWSDAGQEDSNRCCTPDAMAQARRVAAQLGIPFYTVDAREVFHAVVVEAFIAGYQAGITPNPCLRCNEFIRWGFLLERARAVGADYFATGHYARLRREPGGQVRLLRGADPAKDQSYVLSVLSQAQLAQTLLPVGEYTKEEVRRLARGLRLAPADRPDSQDLCFLAGGDYRAFLQAHAPEGFRPGDMVNRRGEVLGRHAGLANYTIGQRKGLGLASGEALYVVEKRIAENVVVVGPQAELGRSVLTARSVNWICRPEGDGPFSAQVKIRYKAREAPGLVTPLENNRLRVEFPENLRDITPGQGAVLYNGDMCIASGIIEE
jgi:tRNA-specific 2-thiouridylase